MTTLLNNLVARANLVNLEALLTGALTVFTFAGMYAMIANM